MNAEARFDPPDREGRGTIDESFSVLAVSLTRVDLGRSKWDKPDIDSTPSPEGVTTATTTTN